MTPHGASVHKIFAKKCKPISSAEILQYLHAVDLLLHACLQARARTVCAATKFCSPIFSSCTPCALTKFTAVQNLCHQSLAQTLSCSITSSNQKMPRHESHEENCGVCRENAGELELPYGIVWENDLWLLRHFPPPGSAVGWVTLQTKRHVPGPGYFDDREVVSFGPTLRHVCKVLQEATASLRIYVAAMGESAHHFHMHLVPKYEDGPKAWAVFGQAAEVAAGRLSVDASKVEALVVDLRARLAANPPTRRPPRLRKATARVVCNVAII